MLAIVSVILLHSLPTDILFLSGSPYHIWQTVPIFLILAGYNTANSYKKRNFQSLNQFYNLSFLYNKIERLIYPFLLVWLFQVVAFYVFSDGMNIKALVVSLITGGWGPGSYFIPIIIQATLILPLIYLLCRKNLTKMTILLFIVSLIFELICLLINIPDSIYRIMVIRYLFALTLGVWLALNTKEINYKILIPLSVLSLIYITGVNYYDWSFIMEKSWLSQHAPSYFYTILLIIIGLRVYKVKAENKISKLFVKIGQASYHIFLAQMVYFWAISVKLPDIPLIMYILVSLVVCIILGLLFFELENWVRKVIKTRSNNKKVAA